MKQSMMLLLLLLATDCYADANEKINQLEMDLVGAYNPLGLQLSASTYRRYTYSLDEQALWKDLYFQAGGQLGLTPAYQRAGVHLEWLPIAVLKTRLQFDRYYHAGNNGSLLAFASRTDPFDDDVIDARKGEELTTYSSRYLVEMELRARLDNIIVRNISKFARYEFPTGGPFYLERENDVLLAESDRMLINQTYILLEKKDTQGGRKLYGPYYEYLETDKSDLTRKKLGLVYFREYAKPIWFVETPRWYIQAGNYLDDRHRQDEAYIILGIGGDFHF